MNDLTNKKFRHELGQSTDGTDPYIIAIQTQSQELAKVTSSVKAINGEYQAIKIK